MGCSIWRCVCTAVLLQLLAAAGPCAGLSTSILSLTPSLQQQASFLAKNEALATLRGTNAFPEETILNLDSVSTSTMRISATQDGPVLPVGCTVSVLNLGVVLQQTVSAPLAPTSNTVNPMAVVVEIDNLGSRAYILFNIARERLPAFSNASNGICNTGTANAPAPAPQPTDLQGSFAASSTFSRASSTQGRVSSSTAASTFASQDGALANQNVIFSASGGGVAEGEVLSTALTSTGPLGAASTPATSSSSANFFVTGDSFSINGILTDTSISLRGNTNG